MDTIPFIDLQAQQLRIRSEIDHAIQKVLDHGRYIMGPEVAALEKQLGDYCGVKHVITCSNGTDALTLGLRAQNVGPGDAVFVPSFTFAATAEVVLLAGATPVFVDVLLDTYNMDPKSLRAGIRTAQKEGLRPKGMIPVDLFGQPADYASLQEIADEYQLWVMADGAQSFGGTLDGRRVGSLATLTTTSFFPAKPLGCYGDGGAVFTNDDALAETLKSLRVHGQGRDKYDNVRIGINGRLDTIQAAILLEKLKIFPDELAARQQTAAFYTHNLPPVCHAPYVRSEATSAWAQYTLRLPQGLSRTHVVDHLKTLGIPTMIYYVKPLHQQTAYKHCPTANMSSLPVSERCASEVLSLPMSGYVRAADRIVSGLLESVTPYANPLVQDLIEL